MEKAIEQFTNFFKSKIEELRKISMVSEKLYNTGVIKDEVLQDIEGPAVSIAYSLLQEIYNTNGDEEQTIYDEFNKYMYGKKYKNLEEFLKWLNEI